MVLQYDTLEGSISVRGQGTTVPAGISNDIALVGGYDAANADPSVTAGEAVRVEDENEAATLFGDGSELARSIAATVANPVGGIYAVPVAESNVTESFASTSSGTLTDVPFDSTVNTEHSIDVQDTVDAVSVTTNITHESPPSTPSESNTVNVNPETKEWAADSSSDYDFTYDTGDYESALNEAVLQPVRAVGVLTENTDTILDGQTNVNREATNGNYLRIVVGGTPRLDAADASTYTPETDDFRVIETMCPRGVRNDTETRTVAGLTALIASQPINVDGSILYDRLQGYTDLKTAYSPNEVKDFERVVALTRTFEVGVSSTTSTEAPFQEIYAAESVDLVVERLFNVCKAFAGGSNLFEDRRDLETALNNVLRSFANSRPPTLATGSGTKPYNVSVTQGVSDNETDVSVGIEVGPTMKEVNLSLGVGEVVTFDGTSA